MKPKGILALAFVVGLVETLGCSHREEGVNSQIPVEVGAIIPLTGEVATYGESLRRGFDLAASRHNGRIRLVYEDSKADPKEGVTAMQKLLSRGVHFFLGDATSGVSLALAPLAEDEKAILLINIATSDDLTKAGSHVFRNCPPNRKQADAAAAFIKDRLRANQVAVLAKANPYGANLAKQFRADAASHGLSITLDEEYDESLNDFTPIIERLKEVGPEAVFVPGNYEETALLLRKAKELGFSKPFVGTDGAYSPELMKLAGTASEGFYLTMLGVNQGSLFYKDFSSAYRKRYNGEPDVFAAYGYEGAEVLFKEAETGASVEAVLKRLNTGTWPGLLGDVKFDADGEVLRPVSIFQVRNAHFVPYDK